MTRNIIAFLLIIGLFCATESHAASFANGVVEYSPGIGANLTNASSSLGAPDYGIPGFRSPTFFSPAELLNPFVSHFSGDQLTQIGPGGSLTLKLHNFVNIGAGLELGVFGNTALTSVGDHVAGNPAEQFGNDEVVIEVSETGQPGEWAALNGGARVAIDTPANYFADAGGLVSPTELVADLTPLVGSLTPADFGKPFSNPTGVSLFDGRSISQIETLLAGSAGGDWFDLDGLEVNGQPLTRVGYVRFSDPFDPSLFGTANLFELMAVSINSDLAGGFVPEPSAFVLCLLSILSSTMLRNRNHR